MHTQNPRVPGQARSLERRARVLDAAVDLLLGHGSAAVTHRKVAEASDSAPGAVRYYFGSRSELLAACLEEIETRRVLEAEQVLDDAEQAINEVPRCAAEDAGAQAQMLLRVYYGPDLDHPTMVGTVRSFVDCSREDAALARRLAGHRNASIEQMRRLLQLIGREQVNPEFVAAVLDGAILAATVSGAPDVTDAAVSTLSMVLRE